MGDTITQNLYNGLHCKESTDSPDGKMCTELNWYLAESGSGCFGVRHYFVQLSHTLCI